RDTMLSIERNHPGTGGMLYHANSGPHLPDRFLVALDSAAISEFLHREARFQENLGGVLPHLADPLDQMLDPPGDFEHRAETGVRGTGRLSRIEQDDIALPDDLFQVAQNLVGAVFPSTAHGLRSYMCHKKNLTHR